MGTISGGTNPTDSKKSTFVLFQNNGKIYMLEYIDSPEHFDTADSQAIKNRFISSFNISKSSFTAPLSDVNSVDNNTWTKFSSKGLTFDIPADWKTNYPKINSIEFVNTSNPS